MFEAFILVCTLIPGQQPPCVELRDTSQLYQTEKACKASIESFVPEVYKMFYPPFTVHQKCEKRKSI